MVTFIIWAIVLVIFGGGVFICGKNLFSGTGGEKARSVIAIILGIITFSVVYGWFESIGWCLFFSGLVVGLVSIGGEGATGGGGWKPNPGPTFTEALVDTYCEYELQKQATKDAIRELDEGR